MFLAKLFETCLLSDGWDVCLLERVNYVTSQFLNTINVNKVVKLILKLFRLAKHSCHIKEHFIPNIYLCL